VHQNATVRHPAAFLPPLVLAAPLRFLGRHTGIMARFTVGGNYAGVLGLKAENYKVKPSFGEPRTVVFDYQLPAKGKTGALEISVDVTDVTHNSVTTTVVVNVAKANSDTEKSNGRGHKR
jgi:hypothetical protein